MSFPSVVFDQMIRQLGELVQLRDQALRHTEVSTSDALSTAVQALKRAVSAVGRVAEIGDREADVAEARRALIEARGLFGEVEKLFREAPCPAEGDRQRQVPQPRTWPGRRPATPTKCP